MISPAPSHTSRCLPPRFVASFPSIRELEAELADEVFPGERAKGVSPLPTSFTQDQHPDLYAYSNSFFAPLGDLCVFAVNSANFAWVQHMLHHLAPNGSMALLLANGSMSSNSSGKGDIRRALIEADLIETATRKCAPLKSAGIPQVVSAARDNRIALPDNLVTNTTIPACIWFLTKNKAKRTRPGASALRDSRDGTLFSDIRKLSFCN